MPIIFSSIILIKEWCFISLGMKHAWQKIENNNIRLKLLYEIDADDDSITTNFDQDVYDLNLPFFHTHQLFRVFVEHKTEEGIVEKPVYGLHYFGDYILFDNSNEPIYKVAEKDLYLSKENVAEYARFFFSHVEGRHGHFYPVFSMEDIPLLPEPWESKEPEPDAEWADFINIDQVKDAVNKHTPKVELKEGSFYFDFLVMFRQGLFTSKMQVEVETGYITMSEEQLLIEGIPTSEELLEKRLREYWYNIPQK